MTDALALRPLERDLLLAPAPDVAPAMLGHLLVREVPEGRIVARITEVEAYRQSDPASHSNRGPTARTEVMFGPPGHAYVYFVYGMHHCLNVTCEETGVGAAVLLRAATIVTGHALVGGAGATDALARGPGRLTRALSVDLDLRGVDLLDQGGALWLAEGQPVVAEQIGNSARTGVRQAADVAWRWFIRGEPSVSTYRRHPRAGPA